MPVTTPCWSRAVRAGNRPRSPPPSRSEEAARDVACRATPAFSATTWQHSIKRAVLGLTAMGLHVAVAVGVEDAQVDGVHPDSLRDLVHVRFDGEVDAGDAEPAHGGGRCPVGVDAVDVGVHVRDRVGAGQVADALDDRVGRQPGIGAAVEVAGELAGEDAAVAGHAVLDVPALRPARCADLHLLLAVPGELARPPGQHRAQDRDRLVHAVDLAAEAAADRAADEVQAVRRHRQRLGGRAEREEQRLGRRVAHEAVVDLGGGDGAAGLDRRLLDRRHLIAALDDVVGTREGGLDIAVAQLLVVVFAVIDELVGRVDLAHDGRARPDRLFDVEDVGAYIPVDTDLRHGRARLRLGLGDDGGDRLALVGDLGLRQQRLVVDAEIEQAQQRVEVARHVATRQHPHDAGHGLRFGRVDAADAGMMVRTAHAAHVEQALEQVVVEEGRPARHVAQDVLAPGRLADFIQRVVALVGEELLAKLDHARALPRAAARTASMIGS